MLTALVRMRCFFCIEGRHFSPQNAVMNVSSSERVGIAATDLVQLGHTLRSPSSPGEEDDAPATASIARTVGGEVRAAVFVDDVDDLVREFFPPLARMGACLARLDGQTRIEEKDAVLGPRSEVPVMGKSPYRSVRTIPPPDDAWQELVPMLGRVKLRVLFLDLFIDLRVPHTVSITSTQTAPAAPVGRGVGA